MAVPKKWWWVVAVVVPIVVAVIGSPIWSPGSDTFTVMGAGFNEEVTFNTVNIVLDQARRAGAELSESEVEILRNALNLAQATRFESAIPLLESVADAAPVPALLNNVAAAYLATGDRESAGEYFDQALALSPREPSVHINLSQLTKSRTEPHSPSAAASTSLPMRSSSQIPGVGAELIAFSTFARTVTVELRLINSGEENRPFYLQQNGGDGYLLDEATGKKFRLYPSFPNGVST